MSQGFTSFNMPFNAISNTIDISKPNYHKCKGKDKLPLHYQQSNLQIQESLSLGYTISDSQDLQQAYENPANNPSANMREYTKKIEYFK